MARRNGRRGITGPTSALSDFLAAHNISASEIRRTAEDRRRLIAQQCQQDDATVGPSDGAIVVPSDDEKDGDFVETSPQLGPRATRSATRRSARDSGKGKGKGKQAPKRKHSGFGSSDTSSESSDASESSDIIDALADLPRNRISQKEDCDVCSKQFTVTPYSKPGPNGGLLCMACSRKSKAATTSSARPRKIPATARKKQKDIMDRILVLGTKTLSLQCIELLVKNLHLAESVENLPESVVDRILRLVAKRRLLNSSTLSLFARPRSEFLYLYDAANLTMDDFIMCFNTCEILKKLAIHNGIQFKDPVMDHLIQTGAPIESFALHGGNLLSSASWMRFFKARGAHLKGIVVNYTDAAFNDEVVEYMVTHCPSLKHISIRHNPAVTSESLLSIRRLTQLTSLSVQTTKRIHVSDYVALISSIGSNLECLSLRSMTEMDDELLDAIHAKCRQLRKLRITECPSFTDAKMAEFFRSWDNLPLYHLDLDRCRAITNASEENGEIINPAIGPLAFKALVEHSASELRYLNVVSARHITTEAFETAFSVNGGFPWLTYIELSFCTQLTNELVEKLIAVSPCLQQVIVFGCLKLSARLKVPSHVKVIGLSNVQGMILGAQTIRS
ncbi:UV-damaged DNA-binding protein rad7 [Ceratocystis pirilliformis]|uniref:UV-damaged DNA-binding protein rad7 n=1 Tax=Ceratocystis pirilliformis TaxID=259994 RepID=A0ABR3ZQ00_9PEZI